MATEESIMKEIETRLNYLSDNNVNVLIGYCRGLLNSKLRENGQE